MKEILKGKKILICISAGVAAYKILELISRLTECEVETKVVLTKNAHNFITTTSIEALGAKVVEHSWMPHIELARWSDLILVAPATANFIAKYANGLADDLASTLLLASTQTVLLAPAMNKHMWQHPATQANIQTLTERGVKILGPAAGVQACGDIGPGRMLEASDLLAALCCHSKNKILSGQSIIVTAGPTQENIDAVRFLSNRSSGQMGYAIADAALTLGARVTLITGKTALTHPNCETHVVESAIEMQTVIQQQLETKPDTDILVMAAAVADYRPISYQDTKLKKQTGNLQLELTPNPDILAELGLMPNKPYLVGFAAETDNLIANAKAKLASKKLDLIIANQVSRTEGMEQAENAVELIFKNQTQISLAKQAKQSLAFAIWQAICNARMPQPILELHDVGLE